MNLTKEQIIKSAKTDFADASQLYFAVNRMINQLKSNNSVSPTIIKQKAIVLAQLNILTELADQAREEANNATIWAQDD